MPALGAITLFVEDVGHAREFYARAFDLEPIFEAEDAAAFRLDNTVLNLLLAASAPELIEPAQVGEAAAGSRFQLTLTVDDADAACAELAERGVAFLNGPQDREWGVRTAAFADPDGHVWELAQSLG